VVRPQKRSLRLCAVVQEGEISRPGTDRACVLFGHGPGNLRDVIEIVNDPGGEQLAQCDFAQLGVKTPPLKISWCQIHSDQRRQVPPAQVGKGCEQFHEVLAVAFGKLSSPIESIESMRFASHNVPRPRNPVGALAVN